MRGRGWRRNRWLPILAAVLAWPCAAQVPDQSALDRAEKLAWERHFPEAEAIYRHLIQQAPGSHRALIGLARVLLWEGRYREARALFLRLAATDRSDLDAAEGAATAAYWQGDFRAAAREYAAIAAAHPERKTAVDNLRDIRSTAKGTVSLLSDFSSDDQPYRLWRTETAAEFFSDPLTRWNVTAGAVRADNPTRSIVRTIPYFTLHNEVSLPWQRLTFLTTAGLLRFPDGIARPIGSLAVRFRSSAFSSVEASFHRHELLLTSTAVASHPAVSTTLIRWSRYADKGWLASMEGGHLQFFDHNRGWYLQGYALEPVVRRERTTVWLGASAAVRDTHDSRFYVEAISSQRSDSGSEFLYAYRGAYTPYWTPQQLRETRAIVSAVRTISENVNIKIQGEVGVARDRAQSFGPAEGLTPFPPAIFVFDFHRTFHPVRLSIGAALPLTSAFRLELSAEHNTTVFYKANEFRATLVRHR